MATKLTLAEAQALVDNPLYNRVAGWVLETEPMVGSIAYYKGAIGIYCSPGVIMETIDGEADHGLVYIQVMDCAEGEILHTATANFDGTATGWHKAVLPYIRAWDADARLGLGGP